METKMKKVILIIMLLSLVACTDTSTATRVLSDQGYTNIEITGYRPWACGDDYTFQTGFRAKTVIGREVTGTVCSGWLKGNSIKLD